VKLRSAILIIAAIIFADQALKVWIKTSFPLGHVTNVLGLEWFQLYFIENPGMAWGMELGGDWGKMALTLFRLIAVIVGSWYLVKIVKQKYTRGFIVCACLIYAGALGNLIDSMFYGMIFDRGLLYNPATQSYPHYSGIAQFSSDGYQSFLHGNVVDMLYFPIINSTFPGWVPFVGGQDFEFFSPIFNIADASISIGVITLLLFQRRFIKKYHEHKEYQETASSSFSDQPQVM
jgi:signal peptidase II